jgi:hypothetical protein
LVNSPPVSKATMSQDVVARAGRVADAEVQARITKIFPLA